VGDAGRDSVKLSLEKPEFASMAKVSDDSARAVTVAAVPGGKIVAAELEEEGGVLLYSYDVKVAGRDGVEEVHVDAGTGQVIKVEHENPEAGEG
jgi:uncharacterized membrane protein YkoI